MKVDEAREIISGTLMNAPAIGSFSGFTAHVKDVKRGVLFFSNNQEQIDEALRVGAFGIVFDSPVQMIDGEIAWIKVDNIKTAAIRLARYILLTQNVGVFFMNEIQYMLAQKIITDDNAAFFDDEPAELLSVLENKQPSKIIIKNKALLDIVLEYTPVIIPEKSPFDISEQHSIFEVRFYYKIYRYRLPLPAVFLGELGSVVCFCMNERIEFNIGKFEPIPSLLPLYLNQEARIVPFGQSERVVIPTNNKEIFLRYLQSLITDITYAKIDFFIPTILNDEDSDLIEHCTQMSDFKPTFYDSPMNLSQLLQQSHYNFALVFGISSDGLSFVLNEAKPILNPTLFEV